MPKPDDEREQKPEDLFTDLDKFFAPMEEWPAEEDPPEVVRPGGTVSDEGDASLEDWTAPKIEIPEEEELLGAEEPHEEATAPKGPAATRPEEPTPERVPADETRFVEPQPEQPPPEPPRVEEPHVEKRPIESPSVEGPVASEVPDSEAASPPTEEWLPEPMGEMSGEEWERFRQALDEDAIRFDQAGASERETGGIGEDRPAEPERKDVAAAQESSDAETVEAAAEHFAESIRQTPEEVERDLLADLEAPAPEPATVRVESTGGPEGPAPSWVEPSVAVPEEVDAGPPPPRNIPAAFLSGGILAAAALALLAIGKAPFVVLAIVVILLGQGEFYAVLKSRGVQPATALGLTAGALVMAGAYGRGEGAALFMLFLAMALSVPWYMAAAPRVRRGVVMNVGATLLGVFYVPFLASFALIILRIPGDTGRNLLVTVLGLTVLYDVSAYAIGSLWGNRPLAPSISPKKSWEGVVGATFVLLLVALAIVPSIEPFTAARAVGLALVIAVAAPVGDLVESALKRDLGLKDMGSLLPGHGGVLDRVDSLLFAAPAAWYFMRLVIL